MQQIISTIKNSINQHCKSVTEDEKQSLEKTVLQTVLLSSMSKIVDKVEEKNKDMWERVRDIVQNQVGPEEVNEVCKICNILQIEVEDIVEKTTDEVLEKIA